MDNIFDNIQATAFNVVAQTMGTFAKWKPAGLAELTAQVLYKDATAKFDIADVELRDQRHIMEYREGDFPGLYEAIRSGELQTVTITLKGNAVAFYCQRPEKKFDGKTIITYLIEK